MPTFLASCTYATFFGIAAGLALAAPAIADASSEVVTAATHAELAAGSGDLEGVHTHLHHTLNCLVGPGGNGFDAKVLNPCGQSGHGAIPDTSDATKKSSLEAAADKVRAGLASNNVKEARGDASGAASLLKPGR
jgi:hypothetical protein